MTFEKSSAEAFPPDQRQAQERDRSSASSFQSRLTFGAAVGFVGQFVTIAGGLAVQVMLARHLSISDYGAYAVTTTLTYLFAVLGRWGLHSVAVRAIARALALADMIAARAAAVRIALMALVCSVLCVPILGFLVIPVSDKLLLSERLSTLAVWVLAITVGAEVARFVWAECFRGFHMQGASTALGNAGRTILLLGLVAFLLLVDNSAALDIVLRVAMLSSLLSAAIAGLSLVVWLRRQTVVGCGQAERVRAFARQGFPFLTAELCAFCLATGDVLIASYFSSESDTALYATASRAAAMLSVPAFVLVGLLAPTISTFWTQGNIEALQRILTKAVTWTSGAAFIGLSITIVAGSRILSLLFGDRFTGATPLLWILAVGMTANVLFGQGAQVLMLCGLARLAATTTLVFGMSTILFEVLLGALFDTIGIAIASASGLIAQQMTMVWLARRRIGVRAYPFAGLRRSTHLRGVSR